MSLKKPNTAQILQSQVRTFGKMETIYYYTEMGKKAGDRMNVALADKNALTAAKEARDLYEAINSINTIIVLDSTPDDSDRPTRSDDTKK